MAPRLRTFRCVVGEALASRGVALCCWSNHPRPGSALPAWLTARSYGEGGGFTLQVLVKDGVYAREALKHTGTCVVVEGEMKASPEGASQKAELHATAIKSVGPCVPPPP